MTFASLVTARPSAGASSPLTKTTTSSTTSSRASSRRSRTSTASSRYTSSSSPLGYEASALGAVACEGYLRLKKRSALTWSTRFVILRGGDLYVFYSKQDATQRRNLVEAIELASGKIAPKTDLSLELLTRDKREFQARVFSRGDLARWVTAFHRLAVKNETAAAAAATSASASVSASKNKKARHGSSSTDDQPLTPRTQQPSDKSPAQDDDDESNPVIQNGEARRPSDRRRVAFHGSVMVRMIPAVPQEQVAELFYTKAEVERFTAQAASIFSRTEDAVSCACLALRRPALPWRSRQTQQAQAADDVPASRLHLQQCGWTYGKTEAGDIPSLLLQEVQGKAQYLSVLFHLIREQHAVVDERKREDARRQMTQLVKQAVEEYLTWTVDPESSSFQFGVKTPADARQRTVRYATLIVSLLEDISAFDGPELRRHLAWLYPLLTELIKAPNGHVRAALTLVFTKSVSQLLPLQAQR